MHLVQSTSNLQPSRSKPLAPDLSKNHQDPISTIQTPRFPAREKTRHDQPSKKPKPQDQYNNGFHQLPSPQHTRQQTLQKTLSPTRQSSRRRLDRPHYKTLSHCSNLYLPHSRRKYRVRLHGCPALIGRRNPTGGFPHTAKAA